MNLQIGRAGRFLEARERGAILWKGRLSSVRAILTRGTQTHSRSLSLSERHHHHHLMAKGFWVKLNGIGRGAARSY